MKDLKQYEMDYPVLANMFGGYFNEDAGYTNAEGPIMTYDQIMNDEVVQSYNMNKIKTLVLPEIDRLLNENLTHDQLDKIISYFGGGSRTLMREQAGVKDNKEWLIDIKNRFLRKLEE